MSIATINPLNGQSNYDLCLQSVGGLDSFISYLLRNGINDSKVPPNYPITYNTNNIISTSIAGNVYTTGSPVNPFITLEDNDGTTILDNDGTILLDNT